MADREGTPPPTPESPDDLEAAVNGGAQKKHHQQPNGNRNGANHPQYLQVELDEDEEAQLLSPGAFRLDYAEAEDYDEEEDGDGDGDGTSGFLDDEDYASSVPSGLLAKFAARRQAAAAARRRRTRRPPPLGGGGPGLLERTLVQLRLTGPSPQPRTHIISSLWPSLQDAPSRWLARRLPRDSSHRAWLLAAYLLVWFSTFALGVLIANSAGAGGKDASGAPLVHLDCVDALWERDSGCGLDGARCRPFGNDSFAFHCPAGCAGVRLLNPRAVGGRVLNYRPLVVGSQTYRGDSFLCASAIHAGAVSDAGGGCGVVNRIGAAQGFRASTANGIESVPFDSYFPLAFTVTAAADAGLPCAGGGGVPSRAVLLVMNLFFSAVLSVFTTSPAALFFPVFVALFAHVGLVSDTPGVSWHSTTFLADLVSIMAERLLPALFVAAIFYRYFVRRTLGGGSSNNPQVQSIPPAPQFEKTILWLGFFWFGALSNSTLDWIPISRLTAHDLEQQPGAKVALAVIIVILTLIVAQQAYDLWAEGRLPRILGLLLLELSGIAAALLFLPGLELRIHHYILAILLLPGTAMQTRPSLAYQGLLLGLFVNGIARWGFASVLQTASALRGDAAFGSALPSLLAEPLIQSSGSGLSSISFEWAQPPPASVDGISVLVNDVERHRAFFAEPDVGGSPTTGGAAGFVWARQAGAVMPEYFRFGYVRDGMALDYIRAGVWNANGTWSRMEPETPP